MGLIDIEKMIKQFAKHKGIKPKDFPKFRETILEGLKQKDTPEFRAEVAKELKKVIK